MDFCQVLCGYQHKETTIRNVVVVLSYAIIICFVVVINRKTRTPIRTGFFFNGFIQLTGNRHTANRMCIYSVRFAFQYHEIVLPNSSVVSGISCLTTDDRIKIMNVFDVLILSELSIYAFLFISHSNGAS